MTDPFREHRLSPREVRRILRRAAELADHDAETAGVERSMTRGELESAAADLGLPASAIARAARNEDDTSSAAKTSGFLGAPTRVVLQADVDGEPSERDREDLIETIRELVGETGSIETVGKTLTFRVSQNSRGRGRDLSIRFRSRDGKTHILVAERLRQQAIGLFVGLGVGGGVGPMGGYIAAIANLGAIGVLFPLLWIPLMILLARTIYVRLVRRREKQLRDVMSRLTATAKSWNSSTLSPRVRVATPAESDAEQEAAAERELEAEEEESARKRA